MFGKCNKLIAIREYITQIQLNLCNNTPKLTIGNTFILLDFFPLTEGIISNDGAIQLNMQLLGILKSILLQYDSQKI